MPTRTKAAYIAVEDTTDLAPTLLSLQEQGFHFNGPERMAAWFKESGLLFQPQEIPAFMERYSQSVSANSQWVAILHGLSKKETSFQAQREALTSFLASLADPNMLLITHPGQYNLLQPENIQDDGHWTKISKRLLQNIFPSQMLLLQKKMCLGDKNHVLYTHNPGWLEALEVLPHTAPYKLSEGHLKSVLVGTQLLIQLGRTQSIAPGQVILLQHGLPVQVACTEKAIGEAVDHVLSQNSLLVGGGVLVVSHPLSPAVLQKVAASGIQAVVATAWEPESLQVAQALLLPVQFHLNRLHLADSLLIPMGGQSCQFQITTIDAHQVAWQTPHKPTNKQLLDLEMGVVLAEPVSPCAAVMIQNQKTLAVSGSMALPIEAVEYCISTSSGETEGAVCVITGEIYDEALIHLLVQSRIAGVLFLNTAGYSPEMVQRFRKLPIFVGTYTEQGMREVLHQVGGVRHG